MWGQRGRQWPNIEPTLDQRLVSRITICLNTFRCWNNASDVDHVPAAIYLFDVTPPPTPKGIDPVLF